MGNPQRPLAHPPHLLTEEQRKLAHDMIGRANVDTDWLDDLSIEQLQEVDDIVFCCEGCNWWCAAEECNERDGWFCDECAGERKDD